MKAGWTEGKEEGRRQRKDGTNDGIMNDAFTKKTCFRHLE